MAINQTYDEGAVAEAIADALENFYESLLEKIDGLDIVKIMKRKNPYLYRAKAIENASEIVSSVLDAFISSSEETIFGNCFLNHLQSQQVVETRHWQKALISCIRIRRLSMQLL